jgi:NADH:ubiquinone oxidoreductase subunit 2 (subunit N)
LRPRVGAWPLFWAIAGLQVADLATTYQVLAMGGQEGNVFMKEVILTPMAPIVKGLALVLLAAIIVRSQNYGSPRPSRLYALLWIVLVMYLIILANNLAIVLFP